MAPGGEVIFDRSVLEMQAVLFLHSCYYKIEDAQEALDNYFTIRSLCPEIFNTPEEQIIKQATTSQYIVEIHFGVAKIDIFFVVLCEFYRNAPQKITIF